MEFIARLVIVPVIHPSRVSRSRPCPCGGGTATVNVSAWAEPPVVITGRAVTGRAARRPCPARSVREYSGDIKLYINDFYG